MPPFVHEIAPADLALLFGAVSVGAVVAGILLLKPLLRLFVGRGDPTINDAIGYGTASFSLFYALLAGLLTVAAYQNRERVEQDILAEASALGALYAAMDVYPEPTRSEVQAMLRDYVLFTIHRDFPAHRTGDFLNGGTNRAEALHLQLATFTPANTAQQIVHAETLRSMAAFTAARQDRLNGTITRIPPVLWYAVLVGAALNLLILILLRIKLMAHLILGAISAFFLGVVLFVIAVLDDPLRGAAGIGPTAFELLWDRRMRWDEPLS
jgi:hypothetical protein